jgi:hypothetical protein
MPLTTGLPGLDKVIDRVMPGDNIVWQVDSIEEYVPFVRPFAEAAEKEKRKLVYFRFAEHPPLLPENGYAEVHPLHPEGSFEAFISEIFAVVEKYGAETDYVFDCLSDLAVDWYSDRMLGNFFRLVCPYLYDFATVGYFALLKDHHSFHALSGIHSTAQILIDVYRNEKKLFIHPQKVKGRHSPTMYMLHSWEGDRFLPVMRSAAITEILSKVSHPWLEFTVQRLGIWTRTFMEAQEAFDAVQAGRKGKEELAKYFSPLLRMVITRDPRVLKLAGKYFDLSDLLNIRKRMIGTGLIGGKSVGMLLARAILRARGPEWLDRLESHDSFFIGSDVFYTFLVENDCWWVRRKQKDEKTLLDGAEELQKKMLGGTFPEFIRGQFVEMLNYFGQSPIIVRSSSLLEDNYGNAFSGKYESVFCTNQGTPQERLETFMSAVRTVYASTMSREALAYRARRGLLDRDEQMALLVQRVSGSMGKDLFFPHIAGVGFSFNPFLWNSEIDPHAGMLRLVFGLGTRAVGRSDDDYTRVVALNVPQKRPEASFSQVRKYAQRRVDVLDLRSNQLDSRHFEEVVRLVSSLPIELFASRDEEQERLAAEQNRNDIFSWVLTFDKLFSDTNFVQVMREMLKTLHEAYDYPVDVEFTANFLDNHDYRINLVQCRPFQVKGMSQQVEAPQAVPAEKVVFQTQGPIIGNGRSVVIDQLVYIVPSVYGKMKMSDRHAVANVIGQLTHLNVTTDQPKTIMLLGPGRWGTTTPSLGVPVTLAQINSVSVLGEIALMHEGLVPDVSLGTHFFNDLVEMDMLYLAIYPERSGWVFEESRLMSQPNRLAELLPEASSWASAIQVIDNSGRKSLPAIHLHVDSIQQKGICYFDDAV